MLTVIAKVRAKPGKEQVVEAELRALVAPTRRETGCLNYDLHVSQTEKGVFLFYENWTSREALDAHARSPHMNAWRVRQPELLAHAVELGLFEMLTEAPWLKQ
ncbi:MAG: antibiotic biosynthesis monooxygenase [Planctomycetes bacterium]|nr:antibiotic biosynthesis monooxygenase [Planctomycetota bacterium]